ncbi:LLM class flavin-dependent oxidoreductase [Xanthobacter oligotrophicus]|uniref:LLM class flavin-dependent oxidoreductase n=1 Tax=Xanthobacter oligotrophicus TaxID=2607286 RepID=UPI0011F1E544|nr:LLM class flavin-dependent oxidoreductase [Xanthobacter oligotrophicus]MCG5236787.1 LLM class flavin-dependent oxidoreductase [Xanthobacter oligotrophicus]
MPNTTPRKEIRVNAFAMATPVHHSPGLWRHPDDRSLAYTSLEYWTDLAQILERGKFDALFIADSMASNDVYGGSYHAALKVGAQLPKLDPIVAVAAMARVTTHLGFGITSNALYEPPYPFARRMSTLDHLTKGRIGWNIVTGHTTSGARAVGEKALTPHDQRYDIADEYLDAVYALWEGSWDDDAAVRDREHLVFADPAKIRPIVHRGQHFQVEAIHLAEPSPQRTPVLFQAGASTRGRAFAARHAECIFVSGPTPTVIAPVVADTRRRAAALGRHPKEILFFSMATVIVGATEDEARAKLEDYRRYINPEAALILFSGWTGIDFSTWDLDAPIRFDDRAQGLVSALEAFSIADPDRVWTVRELAEHNAIGGRGPVFVGSAEQVADQIEAWVEATDVDGLNLSYAVTPGGFADFGTYVVPELQRRGRFKADYAPGTLREKIYGAGRARLPDTHPAAGFRPGATDGVQRHAV